MAIAEVGAVEMKLHTKDTFYLYIVEDQDPQYKGKVRGIIRIATNTEGIITIEYNDSVLKKGKCDE